MKASFRVLGLSLLILTLLGVHGKIQGQAWEEWVQRYASAGTTIDRATALDVDSGGNVVVTGSCLGGGINNEFVTVKYSSSGDQQWVAIYDGGGPGGGCAEDLAVDQDGNVYVTGSSWQTGTGHDYVTIKYDGDGNQLWLARYIGPGNGGDEAKAIAIDDDGNVYVTGTDYGGDTQNDYATVKYNAEGVQQWVARFDGNSNDYDAANSIAVDTDGNVYVTGMSAVNWTVYDYTTVKYSSDGVELWVARYNGPGNSNDIAKAIAVDVDGNVYVTGSSPGAGTLNDYATVKYDENGVEQWVQRYNGLLSYDDHAADLLLDDNANVYVTGYSNGGCGAYWDYLTIKYNPGGSILWEAVYGGINSYSDCATALTLDADNSVYVTGMSSPLPAFPYVHDYVTVKYHPLGFQLWEVNYNGPAADEDVPVAIAVSGFGDVYVTGYSTGAGSEYDYATVKYCQQDVAVGLNPVGAPVQIPASGGSFEYTIGLMNNPYTATVCDLWCDVVFPDGSVFGPVLGPVNLTLQTGFVGNRDRTQTVPGNAPAGNYIYRAFAGAYPDDIWNQDSFTFEKLETGNCGQIEEWLNTGEDFLGDDVISARLPSSFCLFPCHPNPFNPTTTLTYHLPKAASVELNVYDVIGSLVGTLSSGWHPAGAHDIVFDASGLPSGIYFARIETSEFNAVQKLLLLK
jgi:uncharacterized delta-60 repeat protein